MDYHIRYRYLIAYLIHKLNLSWNRVDIDSIIELIIDHLNVNIDLLDMFEKGELSNEKIGI